MISPTGSNPVGSFYDPFKKALVPNQKPLFTSIIPDFFYCIKTGKKLAILCSKESFENKKALQTLSLQGFFFVGEDGQSSKIILEDINLFLEFKIIDHEDEASIRLLDDL